MTIDHRQSVLSLFWLRAALLGSLWASNEIIIGSFLHNLNFPFAGSILASIGISILAAGFRLWGDPRILWRAGVICALMKSVSPSAVILGPMVGILLEAFLFWGSVKLFRGHVVGIAIGAVIGTVTPILQKIAGLLVTYGWDAARLYVALFEAAARTLGITSLGPDVAIVIIIALNAVPGIVAASVGIVVARQSTGDTLSLPVGAHPGEMDPWSDSAIKQDFSLVLLGVHFALLSAGLLFLSAIPLPWSSPLVTAYALFAIARYPLMHKKVFRPRLWIEFGVVAVLAGLFLCQLSTQEPGWSWKGLVSGIQMAVRAGFVVIAFSAISIELRNPRVLEWFLRRGWGVLANSLNVAFDALPTMTSALGQQKAALRSPVRSLRRMIGTVAAMADRYSASTQAASEVVILTGSQGSGKTEFLKKLTAALRSDGVSVAGFLSPVVYVDGRRTGYSLLDLGTGELTSLCVVEPTAHTVQLGPFHFLKKGIEVGRAILLSDEAVHANLVVVDEVGPLELRGDGWAPALDQLRQRRTLPILLSVRPGLVDEVTERWKFASAVVWNVDEITVEKALEDIRAAVGH